MLICCKNENEVFIKRMEGQRIENLLRSFSHPLLIDGIVQRVQKTQTYIIFYKENRFSNTKNVNFILFY